MDQVYFVGVKCAIMHAGGILIFCVLSFVSLREKDRRTSGYVYCSGDVFISMAEWPGASPMSLTGSFIEPSGLCVEEDGPQFRRSLSWCPGQDRRDQTRLVEWSCDWHHSYNYFYLSPPHISISQTGQDPSVQYWTQHLIHFLTEQRHISRLVLSRKLSLNLIR